MTNTARHVLFAVAWFFGFPLVVLAGTMVGAIPFSQFHSVLLSVAWGLGLVATFASWSFRDAPSQGKSVYLAAAFTAAWFLVLALAVFPYLFATRGARHGAIASMRFLALCIGCLIGWVAIIPLLGGVQESISRLLSAG
jgi:membrane protein YdbS with pleckstrin-like domain